MGNLTNLFIVLKLFLLFTIVMSDLSHISHHGIFRHQLPPLLEHPKQHNLNLEHQNVPEINTKPELLVPEIVINKSVKNLQRYDYRRPMKPTENYYLPPQSDDPYIEIHKPIHQEPGKYQQNNFTNENFSGLPPLINKDESTPSSMSSDYIPPTLHNSLKYKLPETSDIVVTYDMNDYDGYDYNVPVQKPSPISTPSPAIGADIPIEILLQPSATEIYNPVYNYEVPSFPDPLTSSEDGIKNGYLPPIVSTRHAKDFDKFSLNSKNLIKLQLKEMRCLNSQQGFFNARLKLNSLVGSVPTVDTDFTNPKCNLKLVDSFLFIHIAVENFETCGIHNCGENLCFRIRFPLIRGMKTAADSILTLQCKMQEKIAIKTHTVKMEVENDLKNLNIGTVAEGGIQQLFRTNVQLLRKASNGFTKQLEPHGTVKLGEEIMLRAHVNVGDGWNYSKLTDVNLQRISSSGEVINTANIVTSFGCINPIMRSICPVQPNFDAPLDHRLSFKAIMFQGMHSGDEIVISMKITGCIDRYDCYFNPKYCNSSLSRLKRSPDAKNSTGFEKISIIPFRVIVLKKERDQSVNQIILTAIGCLGILCFVCFTISVSYFKIK